MVSAMVAMKRSDSGAHTLSVVLTYKAYGTKMGITCVNSIVKDVPDATQA